MRRFRRVAIPENRLDTQLDLRHDDAANVVAEELAQHFILHHLFVVSRVYLSVIYHKEARWQYLFGRYLKYIHSRCILHSWRKSNYGAGGANGASTNGFHANK